jgi:hypothetical protein
MNNTDSTFTYHSDRSDYHYYPLTGIMIHDRDNVEPFPHHGILIPARHLILKICNLPFSNSYLIDGIKEARLFRFQMSLNTAIGGNSVTRTDAGRTVLRTLANIPSNRYERITRHFGSLVDNRDRISVYTDHYTSADRFPTMLLIPHYIP